MTEDRTDSREVYVRRVLAAYRVTPGTTGQVRREDRRLAGQLYEQRVQLPTVENALVLAAARRLLRPPGAAVLTTIRSLHYFRYLRGQVERLLRGSQGV